MRCYSILIICLVLMTALASAQRKDSLAVKSEHSMINATEEKNAGHSLHPDAQWYPDAGLGLFIHWGIASVKNLDISWPMIPGRTLVNKKLDSSEMARVIREKDYNLNGMPPAITPNQYFAMAKEFNPQKYDPDPWIRAARDAGFKYAVLTARHHEGFALWPSKYGNFNTKNFAGGKDLVKPFIDACRKYGLKVGLYYSPPDWYFDRDYMSFIYGGAYKTNADLPKVDGDLNVRTLKHSEEETKAHHQEYAAMIKGQVTELLTRYGKIDLLWFDGKPPIPNGNNVITQEEIRALQPGIVMNPRLHGKGDFITFERNPPKQDPGDVWAEFCQTWTTSWANSNTIPFRSNAFVLGQFVSARAWGVNYLLGVGPTSDGIFPAQVYTNMKVVEDWIKANGRSVQLVKQLPDSEWASVPATSSGDDRYLFAIPAFRENGKYEEDRLPAKDTLLTLKVNRKPRSVMLLVSGKKLYYNYSHDQLIIDLPATMRSNLVDVVHVELMPLDTLSKYILTPAAGPAPKINGPKVFGVRPAHPILFTIPVSGSRPITFSADDLPKGVKLDGKTGRISGTISKPGEYKVRLKAKNKEGKAERDLRIIVGETIALTPPMGWNSWNIYGTKVTQELVLANAKAMAGSGLVEHGWMYMNIDDVWQGKRGGEFHAILPDSTTFPNMQQLVDDIHGLGLKVGIYSTPWVESYGHRIGGSAINAEGLFERTKENIPRNKKQFPYAIGPYIFWDKDVKQWAKWSFDYLKYDWNPIEYPETKKMYDELRASGRDVVFSLSNSTPFASIAELSKVANAWRTGGDIRDEWRSLKSRLLTQDKWAPYASPGHWNDPDMMILGWVGWGRGPRPTKLTPDEQYTHMSAWCLQSVPLLLGNDLTRLDVFTISLLTNDEVIAVNQDPLGKQGTVVSRQDSCGVLAKDLEDGSKAAGLFNLTDNITRKIVLKWSDVGIKGKYIVRDLWRQKDIGVFEDEFSADVNPHGVVMISLRKK